MDRSSIPKPVHPTAIRHHGLFGETFLRQHMVVDEKWTAGSLIDEFEGMTNLLSKRVLFKRLENNANRKALYKTARKLRTQCRNGRLKLQNIMFRENVHTMRNILINYKDMQRLYQKMPINLVVENIKQRTFILRKERDRLDYRIQQLEKEYELKLHVRANLNIRMKFQDEFLLDEEKKVNEMKKMIENAKIRLIAVKTINSTFKKVLQILRHDEIFYEPILRSLVKDSDDQANFIKHILHLGSPAIAKFRKLREEYKALEDKTRQNSIFKIQSIGSFKKPSIKQSERRATKTPDLVINISKRYTRETHSMLKLKSNLENIESTIKQIKMATLCSKATEIFPRFESSIESNMKLIKQNYIGQIQYDFLAFKGKAAVEKENVLLHNFSEDEEKRLLRIKYLEEQIKIQDTIEEKTLADIKHRASAFVLLTYGLWNLSDIMKYVDRTQKVYRLHYPNSYLKLPLLKFEMHAMRVCPPDLFEDDNSKLIKELERKLGILLKAYDDLTHGGKALKTSQELWEEFYKIYFASPEHEEHGEEMDENQMQQAADALADHKIMDTVPTRKQIKQLSAKLVEELSKQEQE